MGLASRQLTYLPLTLHAYLPYLSRKRTKCRYLNPGGTTEIRRSETFNVGASFSSLTFTRPYQSKVDVAPAVEGSANDFSASEGAVHASVERDANPDGG